MPVTPEQFLQVASLLPEAVLLLSREGVILTANAAARRLLSAPSTHLPGRPLADFLAVGGDQAAEYLASCARTASPLPGRLTVRGPGGTATVCYARGARLPGGNGEGAALFLRLVPQHESPSEFARLTRHIDELTREIALRRRVEEERNRQQRALQEAHEELTVAAEELQAANEELVVTNEELQHQQQELRRASEQKDHFLAMLAHELRNPLTPIRTAVQVLALAPPESDVWRRNRDTIGRQVAHMSRLINDLLDVSRLTAGKMSIHRTSVELGELVRQTVEDFRASVEAEGIALTLRVPGAPVRVLADADRIAQALANLLENARKFTLIGGEVEVSLATEGGFAVLRVRDNGIGIDPEDLPYLFDTFAQGSRPDDGRQGGLGLGLGLVRGIVALHRGEVRAASGGRGQGAELTVRLHLAPGTEAGHAAQRTPRGAAAGRLLLIEDNADLADSLHDLLALHGYEVAVARTGEEGVALAREIQPPVVLSDIGLPGMDGYAVARALRAEPALRTVRLIAVTGFGSAADRDRATEAGFDQHLVKPIDPDSLLSLLRENHSS